MLLFDSFRDAPDCAGLIKPLDDRRIDILRA
jgi:hypothetical protein